MTEPKPGRAKRVAQSSRTLTAPTVRHLLAVDLPDLPYGMAYEADTYLLSIIASVLLDDEDRERRHDLPA